MYLSFRPSSARSLVGLSLAVLSYGCFGGGSCSPDPGRFSSDDAHFLRIKVDRDSFAQQRVSRARVRFRFKSDSSSNSKPYESEPYLLVFGERACPTCEDGTTPDVGVSDGTVEVLVEGFGAPARQMSDAGVDASIVTDAGPLEIDPQTKERILVRRTSKGKLPRGVSELTLKLEQACLYDQGGPACAAGSTCSNGTCIAEDFRLEDLRIVGNSNNAGPEACPAATGSPEVIVGTGEDEFTALTPGATMPVYSGSQGGNHILVSVQTRNLSSRGSFVLMEGKQPGTGLETPLTSFVVPFVAKGTVCEALGFRYELAPSAFVGKPLDLKVTVGDGTGARATQTVRVEPSSE
jgi:hypothetical protein